MNRKAFSLAIALAITMGAGAASAQQWDPTQSWLYRNTGWVDRAYPAVNNAQRVAPYVAPSQYKPEARVFHYGFAAGNYLNNRLNLGGQVYQRFMATPPSGGSRHR